MIADAFVNILDDILDINNIDNVRGNNVRKLYVRTIILAENILKSSEAKTYLGSMIAEVFDHEYLLYKDKSKEMSLEYIEKIYTKDAYDIWFFFAFPAYKRLRDDLAEHIITAAIYFRTLWLILDHIKDLEEDRSNNVLTGVRHLVDNIGEPSLVISLVGRIKNKFEETLKHVRENVYI